MGMAAVPLTMTAVGAGMQMYGSYQAAKAQQAAGAYQQVGHILQAEQAAKQGMEAMMGTYLKASMMEFEADEVREATKQKVQLTREAAYNFRAKQTAVAAASGVLLNEGSAAVVRDKTTELTERDALVAMYTGAQDALIKEMEADNVRQSGSNAFQDAFYQGVSSRVSGTMAAKTGAANANATMLTGVASGLGTMAQGFSQYAAITGDGGK